MSDINSSYAFPKSDFFFTSKPISRNGRLNDYYKVSPQKRVKGNIDEFHIA